VIASHRAAAARALSRRNAGKLSWRRAASKRRGEMEFCSIGQDTRNFWWMVLALSACDQQDWPVQYRTVQYFVYSVWVRRSFRV
jgi:hypothetical protein